MLLVLNGEEEGVGIQVLEEVRGTALSRIRFFFMLKSNVPFSSTSISAPWYTQEREKHLNILQLYPTHVGLLRDNFKCKLLCKCI